MEVTYIDFLLQLLDKSDISSEEIKDMFTVNLYLTLLALNGKKNPRKIKDKEKNIIKEFLRKLNNLKVKIQLKRKETEIDKLKEDITKLYQENQKIIDKYNLENIDIIETMESKDPKKITTLIDKMTKLELTQEDNEEEIRQKTNKIIETIHTSNYYIDKGVLYIDDISITLDEFKRTFDYLLNIDNYDNIYKDQNSKKSQINIIDNFIKVIIGNYQTENLNNIIIPLILTYISNEKIEDETNIDTSSFKVENIKITDLYSFANQKENQEQKKSKWRNILIPDKYLFEKLKELVNNGMYYFKEDNFILENIVKNISDFKVSIQNDELKEFLKIILQHKLTTQTQ